MINKAQAGECAVADDVATAQDQFGQSSPNRPVSRKNVPPTSPAANLISVNGATLVPHSLVKDCPHYGPAGPAHFKLVTDDSRHEPWTQFNGTAGSVPERYISDAVYSDDLLCYAIAEPKVSQSLSSL